jgi:hypothetical protein
MADGRTFFAPFGKGGVDINPLHSSTSLTDRIDDAIDLALSGSFAVFLNSEPY